MSNRKPKQAAISPFRRMALGVLSVSLLLSTSLTPLAAQGGGPGAPGIAVGQMGAQYSAEELDAIIAPIALYPDQLLTQVLMAASFPDQIAAAAQWIASGANRNLRGTALEQALRPVPWDPAVKSLVPFPQVLDMLATHTEWMAQIAFAVTEQEAETFQSVQRLRRQARLAGYLRSTSQQVVRSEGDIIVIAPVSPSVVYVPVYNPQVVYGTWDYPNYPPYYFPPTYSVSRNVLETGIYFGVGVAVVGTLWGWATPRWRDRHFYVDPRRYDYFRRNYQAPPGNWQRWERDQWRPPVRHDRDQTRPVPPRPTDTQFRPPVEQRPRDRDGRPMPGQPDSGQVRPTPQRPEGQTRPIPGQPNEDRNRPTPPRREGLTPSIPGQSNEDRLRPTPPRPEGQTRPIPGQSNDDRSRPMPPRPEGQARPTPGQPNEDRIRPMPARPEGQIRPIPAQPNEDRIRPVPGQPQGQMRPNPPQPQEAQPPRQAPRQQESVQPPRPPGGGGDSGNRSGGQQDGKRGSEQQRREN